MRAVDISRLEDQLRTFAHICVTGRFLRDGIRQRAGGQGNMEGQRRTDPKKKRDMVAGIITPDRNREKEAYYLTPAARDAGTGLLNKRA